MPRPRRIAAARPEPGIFTDEMGAADAAVFETEEEFLAGSRERLRRFRATGEVAARATVSFSSVAALLDVLTPRRHALIEAVKQRGRFDSIEALANALQRDRAAVSRDLKALVAAGLLQVNAAVAPGHGRRAEISPVAERLTVEFDL